MESHLKSTALTRILTAGVVPLSRFALLSAVSVSVAALETAARSYPVQPGQAAKRHDRLEAKAEASRARKCAARARVAIASPPVVVPPAQTATTDEVAAIIAAILEVTPEEVKASADLMCGVRCDSLEAVEIVMALEERYGISIPDDEAERLTSFAQLAEYIVTRTPAANV